ncbi:MAG: Stp1/IreP family PP2C-type Ser/Thr phosphatase, partial [Candidatus Zixiibacteriota bacterium]
MPLKYKVVGKTDKGLVRPGNEDYLHLDKNNNVFAVCDGMGGHQAGEVASMMASELIQTIFDNFRKHIHKDSNLRIDRPLPLSGELLLKSIRLANRAIYNKATGSSALLGMGTTIVALALEGDMLSVAHVGDSRAYRLDEKSLTPLTIDHSWVAEIQQSQKLSEEEAASVVGKNIITRALGVRDTVEVDYRMIKIKPGDRFILCSDGLCGYADDDEIFITVNNVRQDNNRIVDNLIQMANDRGGADNVTIVALEIIDINSSTVPEIKKFTLPAETKELLTFEDQWLEQISNFIAEKDNIPP